MEIHSELLVFGSSAWVHLFWDNDAPIEEAQFERNSKNNVHTESSGGNVEDFYTGVNPGTTYSYRVRTRIGTVWSDWSNTVVVSA